MCKKGCFKNMKGLIIKSPYIDDILSGVKKWELRGQNTKIRGTIVLLKSGTKTALGTVDIVGVKVLTLEEYNNWNYRKDNGKLPVDKLPYEKTYAYVLENPRMFDQPKPYIHPIGAVTWVNLPDSF